MENEDTLTVELDMMQVQFLTELLKRILMIEHEGIEWQKALAQQIAVKMADAAIMEGKVPMDHLPPPIWEEDDEPA